MTEKILLASGSPRRHEILTWLGYEFDIYIAQKVSEVFNIGELATDFARRMAIAKASEALSQYPHKTIIAADTIVVIEGQILGKPENNKKAMAMLNLLSGKTHQVITAFSIINKSKNIRILNDVLTQVTFRILDSKEIEKYVNTKLPLDKAGSYGLQDYGSTFVTKINGSYSNVIGLPAAELHDALKCLNL